jgi:hypothetical protein
MAVHIRAQPQTVVASRVWNRMRKGLVSCGCIPAFPITMDEDSAADVVLSKLTPYHHPAMCKDTGENHLPRIPRFSP